MAIWRGTGGSGESTSDSTINITTTLANQAAASAAAALVSENNAETAETNAETAATAASSSASNAATSATNAASSASTATTQASNASSSASAAASSATAAATSATTASTQASAASTSATNAASSASSAATSASTATTQANNASTSATNAAASASTASTQATNAAASATTASTQASNASTSATNAASSASSASTSASNAASSAASAAAALDSFDDRYLGSKTSDPTLDNDGNALLVGALYYNSTTQAMKVYDGANWIAASAAGSASMNVYKYIATNGQTTFSGAAAVGGTMSYTSGNIIVFVNGASLDSTDYTATNGTSVVLGVAASLNDEVVVVAFKSFTVADTYTQSAADALLAAKAPLASPTFTGLVTTAGQIKFPATQNRSSDANTLDDYEEGTWTPVFTSDGTNPTVTYGSASGTYVKVGRFVFVTLAMYTSVVSSVGSGSLRISGLPFSASADQTASGAMIGLSVYWSTNPAALQVQPSNSYLWVMRNINNTSTPTSDLSTGTFNNLMRASLCYLTS